MTIVMLLMLLVVILMLVFFGYQMFQKFQLEGLRPENAKMRRKINVYKNRQNSKQLLFLMNGVIVLCLLVVGLLYNQHVLRGEIKELQVKTQNVSENSSGTVTMAVEEYQPNALKLAEFPWDKVLASGDTATLRNYEVQLANEWKPFFGDTNVTIIKSDATKTMTISVAASSLSNEGYETAKQNAEKFVTELNSIELVTMIDFNFTYRNESDNLTKDTLVYSKTYKVENFEKVEDE